MVLAFGGVHDFFPHANKRTTEKQPEVDKIQRNNPRYNIMAAVSLLDSEQLVSYQIQSFHVTDRLELQPVADMYRTTAGVAEFPSDEAPLVRARKVPAVLKKARVSVPLALLIRGTRQQRRPPR